MAVYTVLEHEEIAAFMTRYGLGQLLGARPIADGIENSNYFLQIDQTRDGSEDSSAPVGEYVLTLFEEQPAEELARLFAFTTWLHEQGFPVPYPIPDINGIRLHSLAGKPAIVSPRLPGEHPTRAGTAQCARLGTLLGQLHRRMPDCPHHFESRRGWHWLREIAAQVRPCVTAEEQTLIDELIHHRMPALEAVGLPRAVVHGDLFRDNVLFEHDRLSGVLDFYSAGNGYLLFDLAVCVNDWCSTPEGPLDPERSEALLRAYQQQRTFTPEEAHHWNAMLVMAAGRFWISRLFLRHIPGSHRPGSLVANRDPAPYRAILEAHRRQSVTP